MTGWRYKEDARQKGEISFSYAKGKKAFHLRKKERWMDFDGIMLTEISQTGKNTCYITVATTFFTTRDWFHGRQFFHRWGLGDHFRIIQTHYIFCACYFYYYINSTSTSGIRSQSLGDPCYMTSLTCGVQKKSQCIETESRMVITRSWGVGEMRKCCSKSTNFQW